jgi:hypothetical protein
MFTIISIKKKKKNLQKPSLFCFRKASHYVQSAFLVPPKRIIFFQWETELSYDMLRDIHIQIITRVI